MIIIPGFSYADVEISSKAALLMDANSGKVLYSKNEDEQLLPASVTKIMTLLLAMEAIDSGKINYDTEFNVSEYAASMGGTQVYLEQGERQKVDDLIKAIAVRSSNDAAVVMAEGISGSNESFIQLMNKRALELGMENTHFANATGLPTDNHYTSAYDIGLMSKELLIHKDVIKYLTTYMESIKVGKKKDGTQTMVNTNKLVKDYEGITGIKTGHISEAGHCISASAKRGDLELISVILGGSTSAIRFNEARKLLDYGFANYDSVILGQKGDIVAKLPVEKGTKEFLDIILESDAYALLPKDNKNKVERILNYPDIINTPIKEGATIGELIILSDGVEIAKIDLITKEAVESANLLQLFKRNITSFILGK